MKKPDGESTLQLKPRVTQDVLLQIPADTLSKLEKVANHRDMSVHSLLKFYIGQGLRQDSTRLLSDRVLETTAQVLAKPISSEEERSAILRETQGKVAK